MDSLVQCRVGKPKPYPTFDQWDSVLPEPSVEFTSLVRWHIEGEAFTLWVRAILEIENRMTPELVAAIEQRHPGFLDRDCVRVRDAATDLWRDLIAWIEGDLSSDRASIATVRQAARRHLRAERILAYWSECTTRWRTKRPASYPSFEDWLADADAFATK